MSPFSDLEVKVFIYDTVCLKKVYMSLEVLYLYRCCTILVSPFNSFMLRKSEEPCIWHINNNDKCMNVFYEELVDHPTLVYLRLDRDVQQWKWKCLRALRKESLLLNYWIISVLNLNFYTKNLMPSIKHKFIYVIMPKKHA